MKGKNKVKRNSKKLQVAVDVVVFAIIDNDLKVLLVKRGVKPFKNKWALPGGQVKKNELLKEAAKRELKEETGIKNIYLKQLYTFDEPKRDPRGRVISVAYLGLINKVPQLKAGTDTIGINWFSVKKIPQLAFDHKKIIKHAFKKLYWELKYTNIACNLLPKLFTFSELQKIYEIILNKNFDKRNFRRKIISLNIIQKTSQLKKNTSYRPAKLWKFVNKKQNMLKRNII